MDTVNVKNLSKKEREMLGYAFIHIAWLKKMIKYKDIILVLRKENRSLKRRLKKYR